VTKLTIKGFDFIPLETIVDTNLFLVKKMQKIPEGGKFVTDVLGL